MARHKKIINFLSTALFSSALLSTSQVLATPIDDARINDPCDDIIEQAQKKESDSENESGENSDARKEIIERASKDFKDAQYTQSQLRLGHYGQYADCSSFVCMIYAKVLGGSPADYGGYTVGMEKHFEEIKESEAKAGDIIFWGKKGATHHTGIYDGKGGIYEMKDENLDWAHTNKIYSRNEAWFARLKNEGSTKKYYKKLTAGSEKSSSDSNDNDEDKKETSSNNEGNVSSSGSKVIGGQKTVTNYKNKVKKVYNFLHNEYGFSAVAVAGALGNWTQESSIDPEIVEGGSGQKMTKEIWQKAFDNAFAESDQGNHYGPGIGLAQWSFGRNELLQKYAKKKYNDVYKAMTLEAQLGFMVSGDNPNDMAGLKEYAKKTSNNDPAKCAMDFLSIYEMSGAPLNTIDYRANKEFRKQASNIIYEDMKKWGLDDNSKDEKKINKIKSGANVSGGAFNATSSEGSSSVDNECGIEVKQDNSSNSENVDYGGGWTAQPFKGAKVPVSSPYGPRDLAGSPWHDGLDYGFAGLGSGRDIIAVHNGKIQYAGSPAKYGQPTGLPFGLGNYVIILSTGKYEVIYQEFAMDGSKSKVKTGDTVKAGQVIYENARQASPVDHLHLSIIKGKGDDWSKAQADWQNPHSKYFIDPAKVLGKKEDGSDKKDDKKENKKDNKKENK